MRSLAVVLAALLLLSSAVPARCGDVAVLDDGSKLELTSGAGDESLTITGIDATSFQVTANPPTTLNGSADPQVFDANSIFLDLGLGTHTVVVTGLTLEGALSVDSDVGNDTVTVTQCDLEHARFRLGGGVNELDLTDSAISRKVIVSVDGGPDTITVLRTTAGSLQMNGRGGDNVFVVDTVQADDLLVNGGAESDDFQVVDTTGSRVRVDLAGGANDTKMTRVTANSLLYVGGAGTDWLDLTTVAFTNGKVLVKSKGGNNSLIANGLTVGKNLAVTGGFGDDDLVLIDSTITEGVAMKANGGENEVELQNTTIGEGLTFRGGKEVDVVNVGGTVSGPVVVDLGGADNGFYTAPGTTIGPLTVKGRNGVDAVGLQDTHVTGNVKLGLSAGQNTTTLDAATIDGAFTLKTGAQDDTYAKLNGTTIAGKETVKLGGGANTVTP